MATVTCAGFFHGYKNTVKVGGNWEDGTRQASIQREWEQATRNSPFGAECRKNPTVHLNFWAVYNRALYDFGKAFLGPERYLAIRYCTARIRFEIIFSVTILTFLLINTIPRVEDIALDPNPHPTVERVIDFLGLKVRVLGLEGVLPFGHVYCMSSSLV
jgi:hypothetical protein